MSSTRIILLALFVLGCEPAITMGPPRADTDFLAVVDAGPGDMPSTPVSPSTPTTPTTPATPSPTNPECAGMDVAADGTGCMVASVLGWFWDGARCMPLAGCSCTGADCATLFADAGPCADAFRTCGEEPPPPEAPTEPAPPPPAPEPPPTTPTEPTEPSGCASSSECGADEFCDFPEIFGLSSCGTVSRGECKPKPSHCPSSCEYVCGCDGRTYYSACLAQLAGSDARASGACSGYGSHSGGNHNGYGGYGGYGY